MGLLTGIGREREYERNGTKTKFNVIALEADGYCSWLNTCFWRRGQNTVVIVQFAKVKKFQGIRHMAAFFDLKFLIFLSFVSLFLLIIE